MPRSLVVRGVPRVPTSHATVIVGPAQDGPGEQVWTCHPGLPVKPASDDSALDGLPVNDAGNPVGTVGEFRRRGRTLFQVA